MSISTRTEHVTARDGGRFDAHLALPQTGSGPGLLLIQEIWGVTDYITGRAADLAGLGYVVMAPDLYWRLQPGVVLDEGTEAGLNEAFGYRQRVDYRAAVGDAAASFRHLQALPEVIAGTGVMGFCFGAGLAYQVAATESPATAVCYYGSDIPAAIDLAPSVTCPVIFHFGADDPYLTPEQRAPIEEAFGGRPEVEIHVQPDARHAFDNHRAPIFHRPAAAAAAWPLTVGFLKRTLPA
ncbi:MAG: dienelactone hydrolase family protein [Candidatus Dormibacteraceae bacterium]